MPFEEDVMKKQYDPLKVEKTDHPDLVGGIVWADCELRWIRAYGTRCFNHGNARAAWKPGGCCLKNRKLALVARR